MSYRDLKTIVDPFSRSGEYVISTPYIATDFEMRIVNPDTLSRIFTGKRNIFNVPQHFFVYQVKKQRTNERKIINDYKLLNECLLLGRFLVERIGVISPYNIVAHLYESPIESDVIDRVIKFLNDFGLPWELGDQVDYYALTADTEFCLSSCRLADIYVSFAGLFLYWTLWHSTIYSIEACEAQSAFNYLASFMHGYYRLATKKTVDFSVALDSRLYSSNLHIGEGKLLVHGPNVTLSRGVGFTKDKQPVIWFESDHYFDIAYSQLQDLIATNAVIPRLCKQCGMPFAARGSHSQYCDDCGPLTSAERTRRHRARRKAAEASKALSSSAESSLKKTVTKPTPTPENRHQQHTASRSTEQKEKP